MKLRRYIRSILSLAVAYGLVGTLFLGSIAAGRAAALPMPICSASNLSNSDTAPLPAPRDLTCLVAGCCGCATPGLTPVADVASSQLIVALVVWQALLLPQRVALKLTSAEARAPPISV